MEKNYAINPQVILSLLLLFSFNFTAFAQSKSGKGSVHNEVSRRVSAISVARNSTPTRSVLATDVVTACNSYTWPVNGLVYTISGIYTDGGGITQLFNDQTAWDNSATTYGATVAFDDMSGFSSATTITVTIGTTSVTLSAPSGMYSSGTFVGTNNPGETITMTFSPSIYGVAGNYFVTNFSDNVVNGNVEATYSDGTIDNRTVNNDTTTFGYFSTTPLTSVVLTTTSTNRYLSLKNLSIATSPAADDTLDLTIIPAVIPTFPLLDPICIGDTLAPLPTTSDNGVPGTWSPALDDANTTTYTFTPDSGECATTKAITITVNPIGSHSTSVSACTSYTWPVNGTTYTSSGIYSTYVTIPGSQVIDDVALWNNHAASFNSTIISNTLGGINVTNPTIIPYGPVTVTMSAPGGMYSSGDFVGTGNPNNPLTITFNPPVYGVSGNYFTTDFTDAVISGNITVNYSNGTVESRTVTTDTDSFGYFDSNYINSIVISSTTSVPDHYISLTNLSIAIDPSTCSTETLNLTINPASPSGDTMATAIDVSTPNYTTTGNNLSTNCFTDTIGETTPDVWYKVNLNACAQSISLNTCTGTNFDTILRIYDVDGITELTNDDDTCGRQSSIGDFDVSTRDIVYVLVEGYAGLGQEEGTYGLEITQTLATQAIPTFTAVAPICNGDSLAALPTTSDNGIPGTWSPAIDNTTTTTYTFTPNSDQCATSVPLTITVNQPVTPTFTAVADICNGDSLSALPTTSNNGYTGTWSPALNNTATTTYTFTPDAGQCASNASLTIIVNQPVTPTFTAVADICNGDTLAALPTTSNNGYTGNWSPALDNTVTTTYTFTPDAGQCATSASLTITVNQPITPTFTAIASICNGDSLSSLPTTSNNGYTGAWSPSLNTTATTTYTFTPDAGQCATTASLTIIVNQPVTPTFTAVAPICNGDSLSALPTTSNNGYTGNWSPALDNTITTTYTFTPTAGQCATTTSLTITVNQPITPTFTARAPICNGDSLAALATTSNNGYVGTWSPALDNTITTTYTFTPTAGQCATTASLTITVNQPITPTFTAVIPICNGDALSALPTTSNNAYTGTWSPALNNTATTTYTFTPTAGQCATTASLTITVNQPITPTFTAIASICNGDSLSSLPTTSNNGYTGGWSPALNNTATTTYTFIPDAGQCATTAFLTITVNQPVTPTFTAVAPICNGDSLSALPTTSNNGYTGTWSPALDNTTTTTYTFTPDAGQCASTASLTITVNQPVTPTFTPVATICNGDALAALPTTSNNGYTGTWSPSIDNTTTTTYSFTPDAGQCATATSLIITVNQPITPTFTSIAPICNGDSVTFPLTSNNGISGTWSPTLDNTATTTYTFTPNVGQCATTTTLTITVNQPITPIFTPVATICNGDSLSSLPTTSDNGYNGTWSPTLNNTATTTYTFTPTAGQCATTASLTITVNQPITPTFTVVAPICNGDSLSALPTTSNNGYIGSWSPAIDNTATTIYTFTPTAGQCATTASLTITVNQPVTPTFTAVAPICNGDALAALPTTSNNGYTGSWSPALNNTTTTTYTFTPDAGQCASTASLTINVNQPVIATFTAIAPICNGDTVVLPTTSNNGITGTWSPAIDNTATTTYTFTPNVGQCGIGTTLTITVNQPVTPTFTAVAPICNGDVLAALPTTSNNAYTGTWSPALDNTITTTYTFTPTAGQCATAASLTITVNQPVTPTFTAVAPICNGDVLAALPTTSNNAYTGTWSPALDNTTTTTYTFTPTAGQCASTAALTITVNQPVTPTFTAVAPICNGETLSALPTTSNNGYTGTWSPALDNTTTTTYTFTPDAGQCAGTASLTITVNQPVTPTFTAVAPICNGDSLAALPTTSNNGYTGTWSPSIDNTTTTTYTFTPAVGQCATSASLTITVNQPITPTFNSIAPICNGDSVTLPGTSNNGISGTWSPTLNNTATTTYTFTPNVGQCGTTTTLTITVNQPVTPTFSAVTPICNGETLAALPTTSNNAYTGTWSPALDNTTTTTYTFTPTAGQCATSASLTISVNQPITPTFTAVASICNGDSLSALPTTSNNGYTGSWSPALDNTTTTTYTFTPTAGQCASTAVLTITVNQPVTPTFSAVAPICSGETLSALPTTSNNGYTGTWSPALDNTATTTYTFTPNAGQCAAAASLTITVNQPVTIPTFTALSPICNGDTLSALPTTSNNGISGTWSPALDNTTTTTYTFTPNVGQCGVTTTLTITVNQPVVATFNAISPICNGDAIVLPTTSTNGITGTWSPALDNTTTTTYTFTPTAGQCATAASLTITVNQPVMPTFTAVAPICNGDPLSALPSTSNNGYTGSWSPALDNTTTTTYTFTPTAGQCASTAVLTITINQPVTPTFSAVAPICSGETLSALPTTSNNGYTGTWSPALDNTTTTTYTFTPTAGQCASTAVLTITVNQPVTPTFSAVAPICSGETLLALPIISNNGIIGTWSPILDNTTTTIYTFTPTSGQCATTATLTITVNLAITPIGNVFQSFDVADLNDATIADLVVNPTNVVWYASLLDAVLGTNALSSSTVLTTGATYYAVNVVGACSSAPFAVTVTVTLGNDEFDNLHFIYYPNPTSSVVNISYSKNITKVTLINMLGQIISSEETDSTQVQVDLSRLAEATYFIKVASDDKEKVIKVIKQR